MPQSLDLPDHYQEGKDVLILSDADLLLRNPEPQEFFVFFSLFQYFF